MALICRTVIEKVEETVWEKIESWVSRTEQKCKDRKWPLNWLCWFVTFLVKVITWVSKTAWKIVTKVVCELVSIFIFTIGIGFAVLIDEICARCNAVETLSTNFGPIGACKLKDKKPTGIPEEFEYEFDCKCKKKLHNFKIKAPNNKIAKELAISKKLLACGEKPTLTFESAFLIPANYTNEKDVIEYTFVCNCSNSSVPITFKLKFPKNTRYSKVKSEAKKKCNELC